METFSRAKPLTLHPDYVTDREKAHRKLEEEIIRSSIDTPLLPMIEEWIPIIHNFTVQC